MASSLEERLVERLSEVSDSAREAARRGFQVVARMSEADRQALLDFVTETMSGAAAPNARQFVGKFRLDIGDTRDAVNAVSSVVGLLVETGASSDDFIQVAKGKLFNDGDIASAQLLANSVVQRRSEIRESLDLGALAQETLPAFRNMSVTVDFRPRFDDNDGIIGGVSVGMCHIITDTTPEVWFQLQASDVKLIIENLQRVQRQMEAAEQLYRARALDDQQG